MCLSVGIAIGLGALCATLFLLSTSDSPVRAELAPAETAAARRWLSETVDNSGYVGVHISLALKPVAPYAPHVSYIDYTNDALKHAWWTPSGWLSETVGGSAWVNGEDSLVLEPVAPYTPHINYVDSPNRAIKHA